MANSDTGNVNRIDTTDTNLPAVRSIVGIKYIGTGTGTATIKSIDTGETMWEASGDVEVFENVQIRCSDGFEVEVTNSAIVYVYSKV